MRNLRNIGWKSAGTCFAVLLSLSGALGASGPSLTYQDRQTGTRPLPVERARIEVVLVGNVAETTMTLQFRNPTDRILEGEFVMPLPDGATVSSYALEVNGALREAVCVEKERARNAYESIKRRMVDPGIVEREADNVYRTRVFPIPANGAKELRIGYVETLAAKAKELAYRLPMAFETPVGDFTCAIRRMGTGEVKIEAPAGLEFEETGQEGNWEASAKGVRVTGTLALRWQKDGMVEFFEEVAAKENKRYGMVYGTFPADLPALPRPKPERITLVWDASDSARAMERERIFALVDSYFKSIGSTKITLKLARNRLEDAGEFALENGNWEALRKRLEEVFYDGATDFSQVAGTGAEDEIVLVVTDGIALRPELHPRGLRAPLFVVEGSGRGLGAIWQKRTAESGGAVLRPGEEGQPDALLKLGTLPRSVTWGREFDNRALVEGDGWKDDTFRVTYEIWNQASIRRELTLSNGKGKKRLKFDASKVESGLAGDIPQRLWAQNRLLEMERTLTSTVGEIAAFASKHGLVSAHTSLIVLERIEDYVTYRIPPPEPDQRQEYERRIKRSLRNDDDGLMALRSAVNEIWKKKLAWYETKFPWSEIVLLEPLHRAAIWKKAVEKTFTPEERDEPSYRHADLLHREGIALLERKETLASDGDLDRWTRDLSLLVEKLSDVMVPEGGPEAGVAEGPVTVSVRGTVRNPGKFTGEAGLTLREAVEMAGGPISRDMYGRISVYRQGKPSTYNLFSRAYTPLLLRKGDMIVVQEPEYSGDDWDGFSLDPFATSGGQSSGDERADAPAIIEEEIGDGSGAATGRDDPFAGRTESSDAMAVLASTDGAVVDPGLFDGTPFDGEAFRAALAKGGEVAAIYAEFKGSEARSPSFYVESARILFDGKHPDLGRRVLSNLVEYRSDGGARRALVFWLADFGLGVEAVPESGGTLGIPEKIDAARILARSGDVAGAKNILDVTVDWDADSYALARTERNALRAKSEPEEEAVVDGRNLAADVRIVFASDDPDAQFRVIEPMGASLSNTANGGTHSECGGQLFFAPGHAEYMMRRGLPGKYRVLCTGPKDGAATVQVGLFRNWGRANEEVRWVTKVVDRQEVEIGEVECRFQPVGE